MGETKQRGHVPGWPQRKDFQGCREAAAQPYKHGAHPRPAPGWRPCPHRGRVSPRSGPTSRFMAPWAPLFVKGRSGTPDTGTDEDEFPFSAVRLATPLILGVRMMNFFLSPISFFFFFIYFPSGVPSLRPATVPSRTDGSFQGRRSAREDAEPAQCAATWPPALREALISSGSRSGMSSVFPAGGRMDGGEEMGGCEAI